MSLSFLRPRGHIWLLLTAICLSPSTACVAPQEVAGEQKAESAPPALVEVATVREGSLNQERRFLGEVRAHLRAELAVGAEGEVEEVTVREGDRVERGTVLVAIDTSLATARLHSLRASRRRGSTQLRQARRDAQRVATLGSSIVPRAEIEREQSSEEALQAEVRGLAAQAKEAEAQLQRHRVEAPFDGVVASRSVDPGDWVSPGQHVLDLIDTEQAEVLVGVAPSLLSHIKKGDDAMIFGPDDTAVPAEIVGIVRALDSKARTARVRVFPREFPSWLIPGAAVDVGFMVRREGEGVLVPRDALVSGVTETRVFCDIEGKAQPIVVEVLATADADALVRGEGLLPGTRVIVRGNERIRPGQPLKIADVQETTS